MSDVYMEIHKIISGGRIVTFFQPIVNIVTGNVFAEEALSRGISSSEEEFILPEKLFKTAEHLGLLLDLELLCCRKAITSFVKNNKEKKTQDNIILFLNLFAETAVNPSFIEKIENILIENNLSFDRVGIELTETEVLSMTKLSQAVNNLRKKGFMILIDDFGKGDSNIERLLKVQPDIIKIDKSLISNIEIDVYKKSFVNALQIYASITGAVCLAEGVETVKEIQSCRSIGISLFQGFIIAKPEADNFLFYENRQNILNNIFNNIEEYNHTITSGKYFIVKNIKNLADWLIKQLSYDDLEEMVKVLEEFAVMYPEIESLFITDKKGNQLTKTIFAPALLESNRCWTFPLSKNNISSKFKLPYIEYKNIENVTHYLSDAYISLLSRKSIRTFGVHLSNICDKQYILCINFYDESA